MNRKFSGKSRMHVLALSLGLVLTGCDLFHEATDVEHVEKAKEFLDKSDHQASIIELKSALQKNSSNAEARRLLGETYVSLGDGPSAEKELRRAMELGVVRESVLLSLAEALQLQGKSQQILDEIDAPLSLDAKTRATLMTYRGNAWLLLNKPENARAEYEEAWHIDDKSGLARLGLARLLLANKEPDRAQQLLKEALELSPEEAEVWSFQADLLYGQGEAEKAEAGYSKAIELRKLNQIDRAKRALVRFGLKKYEEAEKDIQILKSEAPRLFLTHYVDGLLALRQGKFADAAQAFQASYEADPSHLPTQVYLASSHLRLGHKEEALAIANRVYAAAPRSSTVRQLLSAIQASRSEFDAAKKVLLEDLRDSPNNVVVLRMLANVAILEGNAAQGVEYARKLVALEPKSRQAQDMLRLAQLIAGQKLDDKVIDSESQTAAGQDDLRQELLYALDVFRAGKLGEALDRAKKLHVRYPDKVDPLNLVAACYLAAGQWEQAKTELEKVRKIQPNEPSATRNLAKIEAKAGNLQGARDLLQPLVKERPGDEEAILLLAEVEGGLNNSAEVIRLLEEGVQNNPNALAVRAMLANEHLRAGRATLALEVTRGLTDKQFQQQPAFFELQGKAHMHLGDVAAASASFERWVAAVPDSPQAHFFYGDSLARSGDYTRARKELERALKFDSRYLPARIGEIKILVQSGELNQAKKVLTKLRQDFGDVPEALGVEGWFALGTGDYATAVERLSDANRHKPDTDITLLIARAHWAQKNYEKAFSVMQGWLKNHPQDVAVMLQLAEGYMALDRNEEAKAVYATIISYYPNHVAALNNLAWLSRDEDIKTAIAYAQQAYQLAPKAPKVLDTFGTLLLKSNDGLRGLAMIQEAAERNPVDPEIQLHLGQALVQQKDLTKAREVLNAVVANAPESQAGKEARTLLESIHN